MRSEVTVMHRHGISSSLIGVNLLGFLNNKVGRGKRSQQLSPNRHYTFWRVVFSVSFGFHFAIHFPGVVECGRGVPPAGIVSGD